MKSVPEDTIEDTPLQEKQMKINEKYNRRIEIGVWSLITVFFLVGFISCVRGCGS